MQHMRAAGVASSVLQSTYQVHHSISRRRSRDRLIAPRSCHKRKIAYQHESGDLAGLIADLSVQTSSLASSMPPKHNLKDGSPDQ